MRRDLRVKRVRVETTPMEHNFMVEIRNVLDGQHDVRIVRIDRMKAAFAPEASTRASHGLLLRLGTSHPFPAPYHRLRKISSTLRSKGWHGIRARVAE